MFNDLLFYQQDVDGSEAVFTVSHSGKELMASLNFATPDKLLTVEGCSVASVLNLGGCHVLIEMDEFHNQGDVEGIHVGNYTRFDKIGESRTSYTEWKISTNYFLPGATRSYLV
jgi:hypothetical protein